MQKSRDFTLLYVEDEIFIRKNAIEYLSDQFLQIYQASDGKEALSIYHDKKPDIIITDIQMPKLDGLGLCKEIRKFDTSTPIIITTAFTQKDYLLQAIELNLVKYLIKPIDEDSLNEALGACFKKLQDKESNIARLTPKHYFDIFNQTLLAEDEFIKLAPLEVEFLTLLIHQKNRVVSYKEIENHIWNGEHMSEDALKTLVKNLRKKISKNSIQNHSKLGYKIKLYHG